MLTPYSTLLKSDQWLQESEYTPNGVRGASRFRNIEGTNIYACGQPTADAIDEVVERVRKDWPDASDMVWIILREEPIIVINGAPYCLRRESYSLRNMKVSSQLCPPDRFNGFHVRITAEYPPLASKCWKSVSKTMFSRNFEPMVAVYCYIQRAPTDKSFPSGKRPGTRMLL